MKRRVKMGMIGGGKDSFIGPIHRIAAQEDGFIELVCGALSADVNIALESGRALFLNELRNYKNYADMLEQESRLPHDERMDFVTIVTPNFAHFAPAMMALEKGFHVVIDKPVTLTLEEAKLLQSKVAETGKILALTHTYTGYPLVKHARQMIRNGELGQIRKVYVSYHQGWLSRPLEKEGNAQAGWRTDPKRSGKAGAMADIGTHAFNLAEYITGLEVTALSATLNTMVKGRILDDDGTVVLQFNNGASGVLTASQIAAGEANSLSISVYGELGGLVWEQQEPNSLKIKWLDKPMEMLHTGSPYLSRVASHNSRTPAGHPEGYLEAFGNIYRNFALTLDARINGKTVDTDLIEFPSIYEGVRGMAFIDNVVKSNTTPEKWVDFVV